jgi:hypothetical protein
VSAPRARLTCGRSVWSIEALNGKRLLGNLPRRLTYRNMLKCQPVLLFSDRVSRAAIVWRVIVILPPAVFLLVLVGTLAGRAATFQTKAPYALLVDYNTGAVLFEKHADAPVAPASTTKILTAEIVFRDCRRQAEAFGPNGDLAEGFARG